MSDTSVSFSMLWRTASRKNPLQVLFNRKPGTGAQGTLFTPETVAVMVCAMQRSIGLRHESCDFVNVARSGSRSHF